MVDHDLQQPDIIFYRDLAHWWPLFSSPADYHEEAGIYRGLLVEACHLEPRTMLELGSGGGNNASHLKGWFQLTLSDAAPGMIEVSTQLNPECEHVVGDMRSLRLDREFDCVLIHDAISYLTSEADLSRALATAFLHCRPGGAALFAPDHVAETFAASTGHGGHDREGRGLRYLEWTWDPDTADTSYLVDYAFLLREVDGSTTVVHDRHHEGLFATDVWLGLLADAGFVPERREVSHTGIAQNQVVFLGKKQS